MSTATLVSVSDYLATSYRPDREYVDGQLLERNLGEWDHGWLQGEIGLFFAQYRKTLNLFSAPEVRVQVKPTRLRVPDVTVVRGYCTERIITHPPFICIEVLSPADSMTSIQEKIDDYLTFGVGNIWIIDPRRKKAFWADSTGIHQAVNGVLRAEGAPLQMDLALIWPPS